MIIFTVRNCGNQKACKLLSELENKTGLIKRKRQGLGKPSLIYVLKFSTSCPQNDSESHFKTCENHTSGDVKTTSLDMWKSHGNNTDFKEKQDGRTWSGEPATKKKEAKRTGTIKQGCPLLSRNFYRCFSHSTMSRTLLCRERGA